MRKIAYLRIFLATVLVAAFAISLTPGFVTAALAADPTGDWRVQDGVADIATGLLPFGTTTYSRLALRAELDKIAATTNAGTQFGVEALSGDFDRAVQLLADEELHPAFDAKAFTIVQRQTVGGLKRRVGTESSCLLRTSDSHHPPGDGRTARCCRARKRVHRAASFIPKGPFERRRRIRALEFHRTA